MSNQNEVNKIVNDNNLQQHMMTHDPRTVNCWGCDDTFIRTSHMILHLEAGTCPSDCELYDIDYLLIGRCFYLHHFIDDDYESEILKGVNIGKRYHQALPFKCQTCDGTFRLLSGLFQHVESRSCR